MSDHVTRSWEALGKFDPLWAILSVPEKRGNRWGIEEFLESGQREVRELMAVLAQDDLIRARNCVLDFGCGVGRLTQGFAEVFEHCHGVDIAQSMVDLARRYNRFGNRVDYRLGTADRVEFPDRTFDLVYSKIVLQHLPVAEQRAFVAEFVRVVHDQGIAVFQTPARCLTEVGSVFRSPIATPAGEVTIDMNVFPRAEVEAVVQAAGGKVIRASEDRSAGPKFESYTYIVGRASPVSRLSPVEASLR